MQALRTINRQNNERFAEAIANSRNRHHVVVEKAGLTAVGFKAFADAETAAAHAASYEAQGAGANTETLAPLGAQHV